jgi:glycosyltransferase involved in cell wall biosynthesis
MKVLISAFSCAPGRGSEPGLGWSVACQAAATCEVWVMIDEHNRSWIEQNDEARRQFRGTLVFVGLPWPLSRLFSISWFGYLYYTLWQLAAFVVARRLHRTIHFDVVHHVTYQNSWIPVWMGFLGIPFVWNAGGRECTPGRFLGFLSWRERLLEIIRGVVTYAVRIMTDRIVARRAAVILSQSPARHWPRGARVHNVACGGLETAELINFRKNLAQAVRPFRVVSAGRLVGWKGFALGVRAFARLLEEVDDCEYWVIGDGPERRHLERMAANLGCLHRIRFLGWRGRAEVIKLFQEMDVLLHPSFHDAFGYVVIEAMMAALPVVCLDCGGPGGIVAGGGGIAVPLTSPENVLREMAAALIKLAKNDTLRKSLGYSAQYLVLNRYEWSRQGRRLREIYLEVASPARNTGVVRLCVPRAATDTEGIGKRSPTAERAAHAIEGAKRLGRKLVSAIRM